MGNDLLAQVQKGVRSMDSNSLLRLYDQVRAIVSRSPSLQLRARAENVRIHSGNGVHEEMDRRAIACFDQALEDVGLSANEQLRQVLHDYFAWATTTTMARYHESADDVPKGLRIPRWSWDGLQG